MASARIRQVITAFLVAALSTATLLPVAQAAAPQALLNLRATTVTGTLPGGQFAKFWLGLEPTVVNEDITVTAVWDRFDALSQGVGFFVLDESGLASVLNGSATVRDANLAAGGPLSAQSPSNELTAVFRATGGYYTIVIFNDSGADASFTLSARGGIIVDDSEQVSDANAATTPDGEEGEEGEEEATDTSDTTDTVDTTDTTTATTTTTTTTTTTGTTTATAESTPEPVTTTEPVTPTATSEADETTAPVAVVDTTQPRVVRAQEMRGELVEQNSQHFLGLEPSVRDGQISLLLSFEPQDSSELARRLNFWVLDQNGFALYQDPNAGVILSNIAIAAGSSNPQIASNQRNASFTASGFGPYTVIVYNNSLVPGTYTLVVEGGILTDDAGQTLTATEATVATTATVTTTVGTEATTGGTTATTTGDAAATTTTTSTGRVGEPGGTYTIQAGDTLSLIARDIYGDVGLWDELCAYNGIADCNRVEIGDVIRLPTLEEIGAGVTAAAPAATPAPATTTTTVTPTEETETDAAPAATDTVTATTTTTATGTTTDTATTDTSITATTTATTTGTTTTAPATDTGSEPTVDLVAALEAAGTFNRLIQALEAAGLIENLRVGGPFTIFAPTDAAFDALPPGAIDLLLANPTAQLTPILLYHVLQSELMSADISNGMQATTLQGKAVSFEVDASGNVKINGANVIAPDIVATNGVIHAIDNIILVPPDTEE